MNAGSNISDHRPPQRWALYGWAAAAAVLSLFVLVGAQCAATGERTTDFDPLGFPGDDEVVTQDVAAVPVAVDTATQAIESAWTVQRAVDTALVYRVQFYATNSLAEAEDVLRRARGSLSDSLAIEFETPYYKIMAGPFDNRAEADKLVTKLRASGYESAWVVEDLVVKRRQGR